MPYLWTVSSGNLPGGLLLDNGTGLIHGVPTTAGPNNFRVRVTGGDALFSEQDFTLTINTVPTVATPTITPNGGTITNSAPVTLSCSTAGATIRYTTDGTDPTSSSPAYTSPITVSTSMTIKAIGFASGYNPSTEAVASFTVVTVLPPVATPTMAPNGGSFTGPVKVTLSCATAKATIRYTTDGTDPTASSPAYIGPFMQSFTATLKAIAFASGYSPSAEAVANFTIVLPTAATPTISPNGGTMPDSVSVILKCTTPKAVIHYTTDGSTPTSSSPIYKTLMLTSSATVNAVAFATG